jgi:hypothetical protein
LWRETSANFDLKRALCFHENNAVRKQRARHTVDLRDLYPM